MRCAVCAALERQLQDLEVEVENLIDQREDPGGRSPEEEAASSQRFREMIQALSEAVDLYQRHKSDTHAQSE